MKNQYIKKIDPQITKLIEKEKEEDHQPPRRPQWRVQLLWRPLSIPGLAKRSAEYPTTRTTGANFSAARRKPNPLVLPPVS